MAFLLFVVCSSHKIMLAKIEVFDVTNVGFDQHDFVDKKKKLGHEFIFDFIYLMELLPAHLADKSVKQY